MSAEDPFDSAEEAAPTKRIDWMQLALLPLWRGRLWIISGAVLSAGLGGVQALMKPNEFSSVGKLLVRTGSRESKTAEGRVIGDSSGAQASLREAIQNQIHLITTPEVYRRLVANLGPSTILEPYDPTAQDNENTALHTRWIHKFQGLWFSRADACRADPSRPIDNCPRCVDLAEEVVSKGLIVFPEMGSSILSVAYTAQSPEVASKVVDGFLGAARAHHREVFDVDPALQFLDQKVKDAKVTWDIAEAALTEYRNTCSLRDYEEQSQAHLKRIDELEAELHENEARLADLKRQIKYYREALEAEPATLVTTAGQPPKDNPEYEVLVRMRQSMQIELAAPDPAQYPTREKLEARQQQLRTQIADIDARLATTPAQIPMEPLRSSALNPAYELMRQKLREAESEREGLIDGQDIRRNTIAALQSQLKVFEECRPVLSEKERAADEAQASYDSFVRSRNEASLMNQLDATQLTNLIVAQPATFPRNKSGPARSKAVILAGALGGAVSVALVLLRSLLKQRKAAGLADQDAAQVPAAGPFSGRAGVGLRS
ncbi:MAG: hypothetical protein JNN27_08850 [Planctomycetes bacterium]|nr:hypothetical protein [Planctomycetota bacterium]